jgi:Rrf2 family transcriptional regulator, nitric oxide-sensitive transcriptional repressor
MRITTHTDYALRLLMYLGLKRGGLATIAEIAANYGISKNHLMKVAHQLGIAGYVETVRGHGGGLRLAMPVEMIILGQVVRTTEPDMAFVQCLKPDYTACALLPACVMRQALKQAGAAFLEVLDGYTLGDLIQPGAKLRALLAIPRPDRNAAPWSRRLSPTMMGGRQGARAQPRS